MAFTALSRRSFVGGLVAASLAPPALAAPKVDLALVLAIDCSFSVSAADYQLQMQGTARAFLAPEVLQAITRGASKRIAISAFLWSDPDIQFVFVPWQLLQTASDAKAVAEVFLRRPAPVNERDHRSLLGLDDGVFDELLGACHGKDSRDDNKRLKVARNEMGHAVVGGATVHRP